MDDDVVKGFSFFFETRTVIWKTDPVGSVCVEDCGGSKLDVCPAFWMQNEDGENENDDVGRMVEPAEEKQEVERCDSMPVLMRPLE